MARGLREAGVATGGPTPLTRADRSRFLSALDAEVAAAKRDLAAPPPPAPTAQTTTPAPMLRPVGHQRLDGPGM